MTPSADVPSRRAILSVHDVMPETLDRVDRIATLAEQSGCPRPTLLVVPGKDWTARDLDWIRRKSDAGFRLAGHGWIHRGPPARGLYHRVHGAVISSDQAEHLSRSRDESRAIVEKCYGWFRGARLPAPDLYVPPAWALGELTLADLRTLPFRHYETLAGFIDAATGVRQNVPLVGFEASGAVSAFGVRLSNSFNLALGRALDRPVRVCLHPSDLDLRLRASVFGMLRRRWDWIPDAASLFG